MRHGTPTEQDLSEAYELNEGLKPLSEIEPIEEGKLHGSKPRKGIYLKIPVHSNTTVGDIKKAAQEIVQQFERQ